MHFSVVICTHNRAAHLEDTLVHLARMATSRQYEVLVVDNNSTDGTPGVVARAAEAYPVPLRYLPEPTQGKYAALNRGIREARGAIIAATDDDARVAPDWLDRADAGLAAYQCGFVGGPVRPLWDAPPPAWLDPARVMIQKVIAISDHGMVSKEYGTGVGWPLGVNVAYRRDVFHRVGLFDPSLGRTAGTLRSQSQREWHLRARAAGIRGMYLPDMKVDHRVVTERLEKQYFRRWYYWHGISRASLYRRLGYDLEEPEKVQHERPLPSIAGVPRYLVSKAARFLPSWLRRSIGGQTLEAFEYELWLCFIAGIVVECHRQRMVPFAGERRHAVPAARRADPAPKPETILIG